MYFRIGKTKSTLFGAPKHPLASSQPFHSQSYYALMQYFLTCALSFMSQFLILLLTCLLYTSDAADE